MEKTIRIGTRSSQLALWQAHTVANQLEHLGYKTKIVKIDSIGDVVLNKPLYELGITGVFTKNLDIALLNGEVDIAVHSFKDVPTKLPVGVVQVAVLKRGNHNDVLVLKKDEQFFSEETAIIATGSLRRKAQWLYRYPQHEITGLRGNVNTRLKKLEDNDWNGAIFASAGLKRLNLLPKNHLNLDWMIPAPAQGAVMVAALEENQDIVEACSALNDENTATCVEIERTFLKVLEGGCSAPIGALAYIKKDELHFIGALFSPDGKQKIEYKKSLPLEKCQDLGEKAANYILDRGGKKIMREDIKIEKSVNVYSTKNLSLDQMNLFSKSIGVEMSDFITTRSNRLKRKLVSKQIENVIITSQNAVEALIDNFDRTELDFKHIFCVGRRTKRLIEKRIGAVKQVKKNAEKLANHIIENEEVRKVTFFSGNRRRDELPQLLSDAGVEVNEIECYQTQLTPRKVNPKHNAVLFFSPSGIESFLNENAATDKVVFCIGETTADKAKQFFPEVIVAKSPSVESVIKSVNAYFQES